MPPRDPRIDAYIAASAEFARPILTHLRDVVHDACPDVEEAVKWGMPSFGYHGILCSMAAHRQHCSFGFWKSAEVLGADRPASASGMGDFGRITAIRDLPPKATLRRYLRKAMALNEQGAQGKPARRTPKAPRAEPAVPPELAAALERHEAARLAFERFSPSHRREYLEWIAEARRPETRERRIATALEWLAEGKSRNWKYERA